MKQAYPLDPLIRKIDHREKGFNYKKEKVVHILERTGEIIACRGARSIGRRVKTYVVSKENTAEGEVKCVVNDTPNDRKITLIIKYKIRVLKPNDRENDDKFHQKFWDYLTKDIRKTLLSYHINIEQGNEDKIVKALYKDTHPEVSLKKLIERWVREYREKDGDEAFILNFFHIREDLKQTLMDRAEKEVGALFKPRLKLKYEEEWDPIIIQSDNFPVWLKGCDDAINIKFKTELYRDFEEDRRIFALARHHRLEKIKSRMPGRIASFMNHNCKLHEFFFKPKIYLREKIITDLNENFLKREGRHISSLVLSADFDFDPPNPLMTEDYKIDLEVEGDRDKITVTYRLVMKIEDLDRFRVFKFPDFREWFTNRLKYVTKKNFNSKTYTEHLIEFTSHWQDIEKKIKSDVSYWVELVGYSLQEINIITDLEKLKYKEGYRFEIEANDVEFVTINNRIKVKVDLIVQGSSKNMQNVIEDVSWKFKNDVEQAIKEHLLEQLKIRIKNTEPEKFYSHIFDYERREGGKEIIKELRILITDILDRWETTNIKVQIKLPEIDAVKRLKLLREKTHPFEVIVFPYRKQGYGEKIIFDGKFIIIGISEDYWSVFTARNYDKIEDEIKEIADYFKDCISKDFNIISTDNLQISNREEIEQINDITKNTIEKIERVFGVTTRIVHFNRRPILSEEVAFKQQQVFSKISVWVNGVRKTLRNGKKDGAANT